MDIRKADASTIEVTRSETIETVTRYDYDFLKQQRIAIQEQKDRDNAARDAELAEVDALLAQADKLGVVAKVTDVEVSAEAVTADPSK